MKKNYTLISYLLLLFSFGLNAQAPNIEWQKSLGGTQTEWASAIKQTTDGGYILAGSALSSNGDITKNNGYFDFLVVKVDNLGNKEYLVSVGGTGEEYASSIEQTSDGGYIVAGEGRIAGGHGSKDYWIVKLTDTLAVQWRLALGGSEDDEGTSIQQTSDGGYIITGGSRSNDGDVTVNKGNEDYWVVKLDASGNITWEKSFGGSGYDQASTIRQTSDGGYIVAGTSDSNDGDVTGNSGGKDYWILKLDNNGNKVWQKSLGGSNDEEATSIKQTIEGDYIVSGYSNSDIGGNHKTTDYFGNPIESIDCWIAKLNSSGNLIIWQKSFGGSGKDYANSISQSTDGGYIVAGSSNSDDGDVQGNVHGVPVYPDAWIYKLNGSGVLVWQKRFGGGNDDQASSIEQTSDGGYIFAGSSYSKDGDVTGNHGDGDVWIMKLHGSGGVATTLAITNTTVTKDITGNSATEINSGIYKLIKLTPTSGANILSGDVTTTVTIDGSLPTVNDPFVQRYYDITPASNANTAQATVTLYFTQQEFDEYNSFALANPNLNLPQLPAGPNDNNKSNVRIKQFHGTFSTTSDPSQSIIPNVVWHNLNNYWVITFPVSHFSRFYLTTTENVLPLKLLEFQGMVQKDAVDLQWLTTDEVITGEFIIERSSQNNSFTGIGKVPAHSTAGNHQYGFIDIRPLAGNNFYRLKMIDKDGHFTYSPIVAVKINNAVFKLSVYPSPAKNLINLKISSTGNNIITLHVTDLSGKLLLKEVTNTGNGVSIIPLNVSLLSAGIYFLKILSAHDNLIEVKKFVKQ